MSDLAATNCGGCTQTNTSGGCNCMWIILILFSAVDGITMMAADAAAAMASLTMETAVAVMP